MVKGDCKAQCIDSYKKGAISSECAHLIKHSSALTSYKSPLLVAARIFMPLGSVHTECRAEDTGSGEASRMEKVLTLRSPSSHRITNLMRKII